MNSVADIATETTANLVKFYNRFNPQKPVKKFQDRATAERKVREIIESNTPAVAATEEQDPIPAPVAAAMAAKEAEASPLAEIGGTIPPQGTLKAPKKTPKVPKVSAEDKAAQDTEKAAKKQAAADQKKAEAADRKRINAERIERQKKEKAEAKAAKDAAGKGFRGEPIEEKIHAVRAGSKVATIIDLISRPEGATMAELQPLMSPKATVRGILSYDIRTLCGYGFVSEDGNVVKILYPAGMKKPLAHAVPEAKTPKAPKEPKAPKPPKTPKAAKKGAEAETPAVQG